MSNKKAKAFLGMGTISLIVVLVIAAIACFAVLNYVSADTEYKLSQKAKSSVDAFYRADAKANELLNFFYNQEKKGKLADMPSKNHYTITNNQFGTMVTYGCIIKKSVDNDQPIILKLEVVAVFNGSAPPEIHRWQTVRQAL